MFSPFLTCIPICAMHEVVVWVLLNFVVLVFPHKDHIMLTIMAITPHTTTSVGSCDKVTSLNPCFLKKHLSIPWICFVYAIFETFAFPKNSTIQNSEDCVVGMYLLSLIYLWDYCPVIHERLIIVFYHEPCYNIPEEFDGVEWVTKLCAITKSKQD